MADLSYLYSGIKEEPYSPIVGLNDITWLTPEMQRLIDELNKPKEQHFYPTAPKSSTYVATPVQKVWKQPITLTAEDKKQKPVPPKPPPPPVTTQQSIPTNTSRLLQYVSTNPPVTPTNNNFSPTANNMVAPADKTKTKNYANTAMRITPYSPPYEPAPPPKQQTQQPILAGTPLLKINPEDLKNLDYKVLQNFYLTAPKSSTYVAPPIQEVWKQPIELTPDEKKQVEQFKNIDNISFYNEYQYIEPNISKNIAETLFQQDRLRQETDDFNIKNQNAVRYMRAYFNGDMSKNVLATELPELRRYIYNKDDGQLKFIYYYWKGMYQPLSVDVVNRLQNKIDKKIVPDNAYDLGIATRYGRIILDNDGNIYRIYNGEVMPFPVATVNQKGKIVPIKYDLTGVVELDDVLSFASEKDRKYLEQKFPPKIMSQSRPTAAELGAALYNDPVYKRIANNPEFLYTMYKRKQTEAEQAGPIKSALAGFGESLAEIPRQALNLLRGEENKVETLPVEYKEPLAYEVGSLAGSFIPAMGLGGAAGGAAKLASSALKLGKIPSRIITIGSTATGIGTEHNLTVLNKYQRGDLTAGQAAESIAINTAMNIGGIATGTAIGIPVAKGIKATGKLSIPKFIRASLLSGVDNAGWTFVSGKIDQKPEFFLAPLAQAPTTSKEKKFTITPEEAHNLGLSFMVGLVFPIFDVAYGKQARREYELKQGLKISPEAQATADRVIKTIVQEPEVKTAIENDDQVALNRAAEKVAPQVAKQENISPQTANNLIKTLIDPDYGASQIIATLANTKDTKEANEYFKNITNIDNFFADKESQRLQGAVHKVFETHKINPENIQNVQAVTGEGKKKGYIIYTDDGDTKTLHYISNDKHIASLSNKEAPVDMYRNELGILNEYLTRQKQKGILPNDLDIYINTETKVPTLHQGEMTQPGFKNIVKTITGDIPNEIKYEPTPEETPTIVEPKPEQLPEQIIEPPKTEPETTEMATPPKEAIPPTEETIQPETVAGETAAPIKETQQPEQTEIAPARPVEPEITEKPTQTENIPIEQTKPTEIPPKQTEKPLVKEETIKPIETTKTEEIPPQTEVKPAKNTIEPTKVEEPIKTIPEQPVIKGEEPVKAEPVKAEPIKPEPAKVKEEPTTQTKQTVKVAETPAEQPTPKSVVKSKEQPQKELKKKSIPSPTKILEQRTTEKITKQVEQDAKNIEATGSVNKSGHTQFAKLQDEYVAKQTKNISNKVARNKFLYENKVDASNLSDYTKNITEYITPKTYAKAFNEAKTVADVVKFLKDRNINIKLTPNEHTIFNTHEQIKTNYPTAILSDIVPFEDGPIKGVLYKYDNINIVARYTPDGKITIQDMPKIIAPETIETPPPKQQKKRTATNKQLENDILTRQTLQAGLKDIDGTVKQSKEFKYNQKIINKISNLIDNDKNSPVYLTKISEGTERGYLTLDWGGEDNLHNALTLLGLSDQEAQDFIKLNHLGKYQHLENGTVTFKPLQNDLSINSDENTLYMSLIPGLEKLPGAIHNLFKRAFDQYDEKAMGNLYKNRGLPDAYSTEFARKDINIPMAKEDILAYMQDYPELQALYNERPNKPYSNYISVVNYLDRIKETNPSKLSEATANAKMYLRQNETKQLWGAPIVQLEGDAVTRLRRLMIKDGVMPVARKDQEWKEEIFNPFIKKLKGADKEIKEMGIKAPNSMAYYIGEIGDRVFRDLEDAWRAADEYPKEVRDLERQNIRTNNLKGNYLKDDLIIEYAHKVFKQEAPELSKLLSKSKDFQQQVIDLYKNKIDAEQWLTDYAILNNITSDIIDVNRHTVADLPTVKERYEKLIDNREQTNKLLTSQLKNLEEDNVTAKGFRDQIKQNEALIAKYEEYVDLLDKAIKFKDHSILIQHSTRDWDMKYRAPYGLSIYEVNKNYEKIPTYKQTEPFYYMLYYDSEKKVNNFMQYGINIGGRHLRLPPKDLKYPANIFIDEAGRLYKVQTFKYEFKTNLALTEAKEIVASILKTSNIAENLNANKAKIVGKISEYKTYLEGLADEGMLDSSAMEYFDDVDDMLNSLTHSQAEAELERVLRRMLTKLENPSLFQLTTNNSFGYHPDDLLQYTGKKVNKDSYYLDAMNKNKESLQKSELDTRCRNILLDELMTLHDMGIEGRYPRLVQDLHDIMLNINVSTVKQTVDAFNNSKIGVMGRAVEQLGVGTLYFTNAVLATKNRLNGTITNSTYLMSQLAALNKMYDKAKGTTVVKRYAQAEVLSQMELFKEHFANASPYGDPFLNTIHQEIFKRNVIQPVIVEGVTSQFGKSLRKIVEAGYSPMKHTEFMNRYASLMMQAALDAPTYKDLIANGKITEEAAIDEVLARGLDVSFKTQGIYEKEWRSGIERWLIDHVPLGKWFITMKSPFINQLYYIGNYIADLTIRAGASQQKKMAVAGLGAFAIASTLLVGYSNMPGTEDAKMLIEDLVQMSNQDKNFKIDVWMEEQAVQYLMNLGASEKNARKFYGALYDGVLGTFTNIRLRQLGDMSGLLDAFIVDITRDMIRNAKTQSKEDFIRSTFRKRLPQIYNLAHGYNALTSGILTDRNGMPLRDISTLEAIKLMIFGESNLDVHTGLEIYNKSNMTPADRIEDITKFETLNLKRNEKDNLTDAINRLDQSQKDKIDEIYRNYYGLGKPRKTKKYKEMLKVGKDYIDDLLQDENIRNLIIQFDPQVDRYYGRNTEAERNLNALEQAAARYVSSAQRADMTNDILQNVLHRSNRVKSIYADDKYKGRSIEDYPEEEQIKRFLDLYIENKKKAQK
ncbi:MAG TPA: hypothetical protein P5545_00850 [Bacteroidota bacterium]|nr:hypothetical protein [Bacteroidota bacterium]